MTENVNLMSEQSKKSFYFGGGVGVLPIRQRLCNARTVEVSYVYFVFSWKDVHVVIIMEVYSQHEQIVKRHYQSTVHKHH